MQLNNIKLNISVALAVLFFLGGKKTVKISANPCKSVAKTNKNMKKMTKTRFLGNATIPSPFPPNPRLFHYPLFVKANPISRTQESPQPLAAQTLTAINTPKTTKKANPKQTQSKANQTQFQKSQKTSRNNTPKEIPRENKPNSNPILARRPVGVVIFTNRKIPSLFQGRTSLFQNLFMRNEPNFSPSNITATSCITVVYNDFQRKTKNGTNPIRTQFSTHYFLLSTLSGQKPAAESLDTSSQRVYDDDTEHSFSWKISVYGQYRDNPSHSGHRRSSRRHRQTATSTHQKAPSDRKNPNRDRRLPKHHSHHRL